MKAITFVLLSLVLSQITCQQDPILIPGFLSNPEAATTDQESCDNYEVLFDEQELKIIEQIEQLLQSQAQPGTAQQNAAGQSLFIRYPCFYPYLQAANPQATPNPAGTPNAQALFYPYYWPYCCCCCYRYPYIFDLANAQANQQAGQPGSTSSSGAQPNAQAIPNIYPYPYYPWWCCHPYPYYYDIAAATAQANQAGAQQGAQQNAQAIPNIYPYPYYPYCCCHPYPYYIDAAAAAAAQANQQGSQQNTQQGTQQNAQAQFLPYYPYWPYCCCYRYPIIYELQANPQASQQNSQGTGQQNTQSNSQQSAQPPPELVNVPAISQNIYQKCLQCQQKEKDCDRELDCCTHYPCLRGKCLPFSF
ncbi:hypothetical protein ABPG74_004695 [Tetrahymena malaccensis]